MLAWFLLQTHVLDGIEFRREVLIGTLIMGQLEVVCGPRLFLVPGAATLRYLCEGSWNRALASGGFFLAGLVVVGYLARLMITAAT